MRKEISKYKSNLLLVSMRRKQFILCGTKENKQTADTLCILLTLE